MIIRIQVYPLKNFPSDVPSSLRIIKISLFSRISLYAKNPIDAC